MNAPLAAPFPTHAPWFAEARALQAASGITFVDALLQASDLPREDFVRALAEATGCDVFDATTLRDTEPDFAALALHECLDAGCIALSAGTAKWLVVADPFDADLMGRLAQRLPAHALAIADAQVIQRHLAACEQAARANYPTEQQAGASASAEDGLVDVSFERLEDDASPVVRLVNSALHDAIKLRVSDIHFERTATGLVLRNRIDGVLVTLGQVADGPMADEVLSRIKVMAELDISERRIPQDGRLKVRSREVEIDLRVSIMPTMFGEDAVLRLLDRRSIVTSDVIRLEDLGFDGATISAIRQIARRPHGMLLVTGPTGSGKTTSLYAAISEVHTGQDKIVTIEDPIEYRLPGVAQISVNERKGLTFAIGLRAILRHDPDKILVGEIRDEETAQIAVQASLTGHLVFTSVHANNVFDVIGRFLHMGVDAYSFAAALNGIVAQRLLRRVCASCAVDAVPTTEELAAFSLDAAAITQWRLRRGTGCPACRNTGYRGRRAIAEVLHVDDIARDLLANMAPVSQLREHAARSGQRLLRSVALDCVAAGETTFEEVLRVVG